MSLQTCDGSLAFVPLPAGIQVVPTESNRGKVDVGDVEPKASPGGLETSIAEGVAL